jgi:hypothetical protein
MLDELSSQQERTKRESNRHMLAFGLKNTPDSHVGLIDVFCQANKS